MVEVVVGSVRAVVVHDCLRFGILFAMMFICGSPELSEIRSDNCCDKIDDTPASEVRKIGSGVEKVTQKHDKNVKTLKQLDTRNIK